MLKVILSVSLTAFAAFAQAVEPPAFSVASGIYTAPQSVSITDTTPGAAIYYTTDGTVPNVSSSLYSRPIAVYRNTTLRAIAVGAGGSSAVANALYTIQYKPGNGPNYLNGFTAGNLTLNADATFAGTALQLTDTTSQVGSAYFNTPVNARNFVSEFTFQLLDAQADGFTFCLQNAGLNAVGVGGGSLGFATIPASVAVKFDVYNNQGEGTDSTGVYLDGAVPTQPSIDLTRSGVLLGSGRVYRARISYGNGKLLLQILDEGNNTFFFQTVFRVDIPSAVGGETAYAGFTGGTGALAATQQILTWDFLSF